MKQFFFLYDPCQLACHFRLPNARCFVVKLYSTHNKIVLTSAGELIHGHTNKKSGSTTVQYVLFLCAIWMLRWKPELRMVYPLTYKEETTQTWVTAPLHCLVTSAVMIFYSVGGALILIWAPIFPISIFRFSTFYFRQPLVQISIFDFSFLIFFDIFLGFDIWFLMIWPRGELLVASGLYPSTLSSWQWPGWFFCPEKK